MKNRALVAVLLSVVSLPAFAQSKFIKEANSKVTATEPSAAAQVEKGKQAAAAAPADESVEATDATGYAEAEATATDAAEGLEKPEAEQ